MSIFIVCATVQSTDRPAPGSRVTICADCPKEIYVSPTTDQQIETMGNPKHLLLCMACMLARHAAGAELDIQAGPTPAQKAEMKSMGINWTQASQRAFSRARQALQRRRNS